MQAICGRSIGYNIILLLLQIILERQRDIAQNEDEKFELSDLLVDPIIDEVIFKEFKSHKIFEVYKLDGTFQNLDLRNSKKNQNHLKLTLRDFRNFVNALYKTPIFASDEKHTTENKPTLITLCDRYYALRIEELRTDLLPNLQKDLKAAKVF